MITDCNRSYSKYLVFTKYLFVTIITSIKVSDGSGTPCRLFYYLRKIKGRAEVHKGSGIAITNIKNITI